MRLGRPPTAGQSHRPRFWFLLLLVSSVTAFLLPHSNQLLGVHQPAQCREKPRLSQQCRAPVVMMGRGNDRDRGGKGGDQSVRQLRVARMLQSTLADVIRKGYPIKTADVLDDNIRSKISVVEVNCSPDFSSARVEVSIFGETVEKREAFIWLVNNAKAIRYALAQELKDFRHTPQLIFRQVDLGAGSDMFSLLDKLEEQRSMRGEVGGDDQGYDSEAEGEYSSDEGEYESDEEGDYTSDEEDDELYSSDEDEVFSDDENLTSGAEDDDDDVIWEEDEEEGGDQAGEVVSLAGAGRKQRVFPPKVNIGGAGLSSSRPAWSRVGEAYVPGALEAELAAEFAALASGEGEDDEDMWGDEDDDEEFVIGDDEEGDEEEDDEEEEMRWEEDDEAMDEEELRGWMLEQIKLRQERLAGLGPIPEGIVSRMEAAEQLWEEDDEEEEEEEEVPTPRLKVKTSKKEQRAFQAKRKQARAMDEEEDIDMLQREGWIDMDKIMAEVDEDEDEEDEDDFEDDDDFEDEDEYEGGENWFMEAAADKDGWVDMDKILDEAEGEEDLDELLVRMGGDSFFMDGDGKEEKPAAKENKQQKGKGKQGAAAAGATKAASPMPPPPKTGGGSKKQQGGEKGKKSPKNKRSKWFYGNQK